MKRRLFNAGALLALLGCFAAAVIWVWSLESDAGVIVRTADRRREIGVTRGLVFFNSYPLRAWTPYERLGWDVYFVGEPNQSPLVWDVFAGEDGVAGFGLRTDGWQTSVALTLPMWVVLATLSLVPIAWTITRARRPRPTGIPCPACGYDLRGTPSGGGGGGGSECPECGAAPGRREAKA